MDVLDRAKESLFRLETGRAIQLAKQAVAEEDASGDAYFFLAHLVAHLEEDYGRAEQLLAQALTMTDDTFPIHRARALNAMAQGEYGTAQDALKVCRDLKPDHAEILTLLGETLLKLGQTEAGEDCLCEAVRENPFYARANRTLHRLYVESGRYQDAFTHWKWDNGIDDAHAPVGTILVHYTAMRDASRAAQQAATAQTLKPLADSYWQASLYVEASIVLQRLLQLEPSHADAQQKLGLLQSYLAMLEAYERESIRIYRTLAQSGQKDVIRDRQRLYEILRSLAEHLPALERLPRTCTKQSWRAVRDFYLQEFGLVIKCFFTEPKDYGTFMSYLVNERYFLLNPGYNRAQKPFREVARDVVINYRSWVPAFFAAGTAGWTDNAGVIYRCTDRFRAVLSFWIAKQDQLDLAASLQKLNQEIAGTDRAPDAVFHSAVLAQVFRSRFMQRLMEEAEHLEDPLQRRRHFLRRCYEVSINVSLVHQDSQSAVEAWNMFPKLKIFLLAVRKGFWSYRTGFIYRSLINELRASETPFFSLQRIMTPEISGSRLHGQASRRVFQDMVQYIAVNPQNFPGIDPTKNIMLQLGTLDASDLKRIAEAMWG